MNVRINPSILAADFANIESELSRIATADFVHVDVMDNHFVPNLTFGPQMVARIRDVSPVPLDVHLMISEVDRWAPGYAELGASIVTFHVEASDDPIDLARRLRGLGSRAGIALKPDTPIGPYLDVLDEFDQILLMTVEPGFGGQSFMESVMPKLRVLRDVVDSSTADVWIQVDGGITPLTIEIAGASGADTFVAGSAVYGAGDAAAAIAALRASATESVQRRAATSA